MNKLHENHVSKRSVATPMAVGLPTSLLCAAWIAGLPGFLFSQWAAAKPLYWILATIIWCGILALPHWRLVWSVRRQLPMLWGICYALMLAWHFVQYGDPEHGIINHFEALTVFFVVGYALLVCPEQNRYAQLGVLSGALAAVTLNVMEYFSAACCHSLERASGFHLDPNNSALIIVLGLICSWNLLPRTLRPAYALFCGIGVAITFSRAGWILAILAIASLVVRDRLLTAGSHSDRFGLAVAILLFSAFAVWLISYAADHSPVAAGYRFDVFVGNVSDHSTQLRLSAMTRAANRFLETPFSGGGFGSITRVPGAIGPHNMYLLYAAEMGLVGLALFLWFILQMYAQRAVRPLVLTYALAGLFTHTSFETIAIMLVMATGLTDRAAKQAHFQVS